MDAITKDLMLTYMRNIRSCGKLAEYFNGEAGKVAKYLAQQQEYMNELSALIVNTKITEL